MSNVGVGSVFFDVLVIIVVYGGVFFDQCGGRRLFVVGWVIEFIKIFFYDYVYWVFLFVLDVN